MLKFLQARLQQYMNSELSDGQYGFRKVRGARDQTASICWITEKARELRKNIYFCFINYAKAFDCVDHNKLWKILQEMAPRWISTKNIHAKDKPAQLCAHLPPPPLTASSISK